MYSIYLSQRADRFLGKLDKHIKSRLVKGLRKLGAIPIPGNAKFIRRENGDKVFRYRIGNYRALYKVKSKDKVVLIAKIDKRPRIYKR